MELDHLFDVSRYPETLLGWIAMLLYLPIGIILTIIRVFIAVHALIVACILPKTAGVRKHILRCMCTVLGIVATQEKTSSQEELESKRLIVTNHVSVLDHLAVSFVFPCIKPAEWKLPWALNWAFGFLPHNTEGNMCPLVDNYLNSERSYPVLLHPEEVTTSGKKGMLKFKEWPFSLPFSVQPIAISVTRPLQIALSTLESKWWSDIFWFLFVPYTHFKLRPLSVQRCLAEENPRAFADRVQKSLSDELRMEVTDFSRSDKEELWKKRLRAAEEASTRNASNSSTERMIRQVLEVLPTVPRNVISQDLERTRNVDDTILRLLEGRVPYISTESPPPPSRPRSARGKDHHQLYAERKQEIIETARRRYLQKEALATE